MNLNAITLAITRPGRVRSWDPLSLFTGSTVGAWYDPSDYSTLFQNAAGTLPVTAVEQPVGLMLDKSKGLVLGPELVTNEDFSNGTTGWTAGPNNTISVVSGQLKCVSSQTDGAYFGQPFAVESGKTYKFVYQAFSDGTSQAPGAALGTSLGSENRSGVVADGGYGFGSRSFVYRATASETLWLWFYGGASKGVGNYILIDNISVRELPGNHAFNSSGNSADFPVLSARYNLLTKTEQFDDAYWTKQGLNPVSSGTEIAPNGTATAEIITENTATSTHRLYYQQASTFFVANTRYTQTCFFKNPSSNGARYAYMCLYEGTTGTSAFVATYDLVGGIVASNGKSGPGTLNDATITHIGNGWYKCVLDVTVTSAGASGAIIFGINRANVSVSPGSEPSYTGDGTSGIYIWGADLRVANDALNQPAYQRVNTSTDYDTVGFKPYLWFNGTNQWLQTNSIDFTYGDKMFVCAGVRKLSDADAIISELSQNFNSYNGSFYFASQPLGKFGTSSRGAATGNVAQEGYSSGYYAQVTAVLSALHDISGDLSVMRVNGVSGTNGTGDKGTGNFGNYPLYIGARAGSSLWFNGRLYGMVVAGKQASTIEIENTENYLEVKTFGKDMQYVYSDPLLTAASEQITTAGGEDIYLTVTYQ